MKKVEIKGSLRSDKGTTNARRLRRTDQIPCVLYGSGEVIHFAADERALNKVVFTPDAFRIELDLDGTKHLALLQETQFHPLSDKVLHADFLTMSEKKKTKVALSLKLTGLAAGVKAGGKINQPKRKLMVQGLPADLPEHLEYDVTKVEFGQGLRVKDLQFKGLVVLDKPNDVVMKIVAVKKEVVATTEDAAVTATTEVAAGAEAAEGAKEEEAK